MVTVSTPVMDRLRAKLAKQRLRVVGMKRTVADGNDELNDESTPMSVLFLTRRLTAIL